VSTKPQDDGMATTLFADDEVALGEWFRAGDEDAMREIYQRYGSAMHTIARSMLRDREQAADAVQQALLQAWRSADRFDASRKLGPWLNQITRRACIDAYRRDRRFEPTVGHHPADGRPADGRVPGGWVDDAASIERGWVAAEVRRAIDVLPAPEQSVARLAHIEGLTHREIASRLRVPVGTVKSRTARAHTRLSRLLSHLAPVPA
jgi:RNA polymerase sigma-70 factor (ECF subfamily)